MEPTRRSFLVGLGTAAGGAGCVAPARSSRQQAEGAYTDVYGAVAEAVVDVHVSTDSQPRAQGSGFVVGDSEIVTNHHIVAVGDSVSVQFSSREWADATVLGSDPLSDIAVLSVADEGLVPEPLEFVDQPPAVGEEVLAIGSPFDLSGSLSRGVVSGHNRTIPGPGAYDVPDAIQTDVALNPGSSGGPIVDLAGDVVGIVIANQGQTVGFAISAALARRVVPALRTTGSYAHPRLGVSVTEVGPALADANGLADPGGLLVVSVAPDGPADGHIKPCVDSETAAGPPNETAIPLDELRSDGASLPTGGDVLFELAGTPVADTDSLASVLALDTSPDERVPVTLLRDGQQLTVEVTLGRRPTN